MSYTPEYIRVNWQNEPNLSTPLNALNLNKMDYTVKKHDDTFANWDTTKANQSDLLLSVKEITYNSQTGVFVFTWQNGTTMQVDLNIEKIPVSFSMDANGVITMTTDDGTTYTADVGSLIKTYTFNDSGRIDFTVTTDSSGNKTITADIVDGSITGEKLQPNYLADCQAAQTGAETAQGLSEDSAEDSEAWAVGERGGVPVPSTDPTYENNAKYWAHQAPTALANMSDVDIDNPSDGQVLTYNSNTQKWKNQAASGGAEIDDTTTSTTKVWSSQKVSTELNGKANTSSLATVATSGSYTDLSNKPTIPTALSQLTADSTHRVVTDTEKSTWNAKPSATDVNNKHKVTTLTVDTINWTQDVTSQSGTTLYKKQVNLNHVYANPSVDIGAASGSVLPTTAQQESYDLILYATSDDTVPCLYLYASDIPTTAFYINVEGVD